MGSTFRIYSCRGHGSAPPPLLAPHWSPCLHAGPIVTTLFQAAREIFLGYKARSHHSPQNSPLTSHGTSRAKSNSSACPARPSEIRPAPPLLQFDLPFPPWVTGLQHSAVLAFREHTERTSTSRLCTYLAIFSAYLLLPYSSSSLFKHHFLGVPNHPLSKIAIHLHSLSLLPALFMFHSSVERRSK